MEEKRKITLKGILLNLDAIITGTTLTLCVILVNANIIFRRFLNSPLQWSEEVVTSLFVWTVFIGSTPIWAWTSWSTSSPANPSPSCRIL